MNGSYVFDPQRAVRILSVRREPGRFEIDCEIWGKPATVAIPRQPLPIWTRPSPLRTAVMSYSTTTRYYTADGIDWSTDELECLLANLLKKFDFAVELQGEERTDLYNRTCLHWLMYQRPMQLHYQEEEDRIVDFGSRPLGIFEAPVLAAWRLEAYTEDNIPIHYTSNLRVDPPRCNRETLAGTVPVEIRPQNGISGSGSGSGSAPGSGGALLEGNREVCAFFCSRRFGTAAAAADDDDEDGNEDARRVLAETAELVGVLRAIRNADRGLWREACCPPAVQALRGLIMHAVLGREREPVLVGALLEPLQKPQPLGRLLGPGDSAAAGAEGAEADRQRYVSVVCKTIEWLHMNRIAWGGSLDVEEGGDEAKADRLVSAVFVDAYGHPRIGAGYRPYSAEAVRSDLIAIRELRRRFRLR